ncbi:uncharacterized protein LOC127732305 [Mytilus californianus]|uniref:uncharacterized protein LOC127732305 n=1 Tax=Mytilus californianus TaxID=6549 RepID=UPI00224724F5|nr:uncharacterized protein LOC127732305 [Mytilus californianus]
MLSFNEAYNFTCPSQAHWIIRAKAMCKPPKNYTCLFDITFRVNVYREICNRPRILDRGHKYVFQPNLNKATCSATRYQPEIFKTNGYSDCTYQKSLCNSLGQETYEYGNITVDIKCMCNTDRGYTFVMNSKNQCYCNPSTDDCSCYLGINQYNKTIGLNDIKCYDDTKRTGSRYLGNRFNISRKIKIIEFDNYNYNLNYYKYHIEAFQWVLTLSLASCVVCVVCIILLTNRRQLRRCIEPPNIFPEAINHLSEEDKIRYNELMQTEKKENRYFVRIMIVGKESTGKTCLLRRLLKEDISGVSSTDGVDIVVRRCKINIRDGKWIIGKEIDDDKVSRIKRALIPNAEDRNTDNIEVDERKNISHGDDISTYKKDTTTDIMVIRDKSEDTNESELLVMLEDFKAKSKVNLDKKGDTNQSSSLVMPEDITSDAKINLDNNKETNKSSSLVMPEDLMSNMFSKSTVNSPSNLYALCELWDFAGQKEFYATHQAFLTSSAVYLVVADMKDDISKQGLGQYFADFQHIGEYVDFWFDSIHCHRTTDKPARYGHFDPPILLVFTGKDKYDKADFKKREKELNDQIDQVLGFQSKYHHLHNKFYLSNTNDSDTEFEKLQYAIYDTARKMGNWGNAFPLKWILLEHLIEINKNDNKHFINFTDMSNLAKHPDINILEKEDLLLFLRFQHNVGNIIFFANIPDLIILRPQWLADAFRCLVSDRVENRRLHHHEDWTLFIRQGKISESLITELFKAKDGSQLSEQTNNLHAVMEKLDILVKIGNSNYIMPSMMPPSTFDVVCEKFDILTQKCKRTSWLCFKFEFLPPSFFNHLSAWFIRNYYSSKVEGGIALYRGICMFDIDGSGGTKILVTMSTDTIALQLVSFSEEEGFGSTCSDIYREVKQLIEDIKERYKVKISFKLHFKCSDGYYFQDTFEYEKLTSEKECFCTQHKQMHRSDQIYSPWMNNEVTRIPDRANISTKQDDHNPKNEPKKEAQDQTSVKTNLPDYVNLRQQINIKMSKNENQMITSCIKIDNTLVFTDCSNKRLIICNSDGTDIHHIPLSYTPDYVTVVNINTVAVSCTFDRTILIINISTCSVTSTINTSGYCSGISYNDNNLYVVIDLSIIHVMDLTGKVIRTIPLPSDSIHDITVDRDRLVCIDYTSIYCCSLDGKLIWKFKKDEFQDLSRVTKDDEGNVYVTDYNTNTVVVISHDGIHYRELLTKSDGLNWSWGIYFDKQENILLVCNHYDGKVFLFDVKRKST